MKKVKIRVLRNLGRDLPPYKEGQVIDCNEDEAQQLLTASLAELVDSHAIATPESLDDLEAKTVVELHELAKKEAINLHGATAKDDIIKAIRKGRKG